MRELMLPLVDEQGGDLVKYIGDDILAAFPTAEAAFQSARAMMARVAETHAQARPDMQIQVAIGIGWGPCLHVPQVDVWDVQANRAFKLGEDTAEAGDILLTVEAAQQLAPRHTLEPYDVSVHSVMIAAFRAQ